MTAYRVIAPYVTAKVRDEVGTLAYRGFYDGAVLPESVDPDSVKSLLAKGMIEKVAAPKAEPTKDEPAIGRGARTRDGS